MLYAILCYNDEDVVCAWTKEEDDAVMAKLGVVHEKLAREGKLGPVAAADADHRGHHAAQGQGPAAGHRRALRRDQGAAARLLRDRLRRSSEALETARDLGRANPGGAYEIRPLRLFRPGSAGA